LSGTPPEDIRPTSDRLRETLFNILSDRVIESVFLDAYAGLGGVGLEAISRGASMVYFVDRSSKACGMVRSNLDTLEVDAGYSVFNMDVDAAIRKCRETKLRFDIAFLDPPYDREHVYESDLESFGSGRLLASDGLLVVEHSRKMDLPEAAGGIRKVRNLKQGDSALTFYAPEEE
jgi:16S rRNA (guanine(966)-N(2))-methyltransferase RsmD